MGIMLALAAPNFSKGYARFQLNHTADDLLETSRWAQAMAIGQKKLYALSFSGDRRSYGLVRAKDLEGTGDPEDLEAVNGSLGRMHAIPEGIGLDTKADRIEFHPDGTIDPATIELSGFGKKEILSSMAVRGMMTKEEGEQ